MAPKPQNKPDVFPRTQDVEINQPDVAEVERKIEERNEQIKRKIAEYNEKYTKLPWHRDLFNSERLPYEIPITAGLEYPEAVIAQIDAILDAPYEIDGRKFTLRRRYPSVERRRQKADLEDIKRLFDEIGRLRINEREGKSYRMIRNNTRAIEMADKKTEFEKKKEYQDLSNDYDQVGKDPEIRRFYERPDGSIDPYLERENKQLFFAILGKETNGFTTDFVLSKFTTPEENKKNYPFIYREWVKDKFDVEKKERAEKTVASLATNLNLANPDNAVGKVADILTELDNTMTANGLPAFPNTLSSIPSVPRLRDKGYYTTVEKAFEALWTDINLRIKQISGNPAMASAVAKLKKVQDETLPPYIKLAEAQYDLAVLTERGEEADSKFTKEEFEKPGNRQLVLELAIRQFHKAMKTVDTPYGPDKIGFQENLHPRVRRMLIATVYYENGKYDAATDRVSSEYTWVLSKLIQSKYFNPSLKEKFLDSEQREFLYLARYANLAIVNIKYLKEEVVGKLEEGVLPRLKTNLAVAPRTPVIQAEIASDIAVIKRLTKSTATVDESNAIAMGEEVARNGKSEITALEKFVQEAEEIMANPDREKMRAFIEKVKASPLLGPNKEKNIDDIEKFAAYLQSVDLNYNMFDFEERNTGKYLERMGINPEGIYHAYLEYWKKNPEMKVDQWDNHLTNAEGTKKLLEMFKQIIPPSTVYKGKDEFLKTFATFQGINPKTKPDLREDQMVALNVYKLLQQEVKKRQQGEVFSRAHNTAALERLEGMTFGDRITEYAKGVTDMLMGPGQSIANRAAGAAILYLFYKMAHKAIRGTGKGATALRVLFMAGAAELVLKRLTGEGLTDKLRLNGLAEALEGTYEDVLLDKAKDKFDKLEYAGESITITDHSKALMELRRSNVPFAKVVEWYKATKEDGSPKAEREEVKLRIDFSSIVSGKMDKDPDGRGRFILKKTIENFFMYVANKDEKAGNSAATGMNVLEEVWVKPVHDRNFDERKAKFTDRGLPKVLLERLRQNPNSVTWQMVMQAEIRPEDVEEVKRNKAIEKAKDCVSGAYVYLTTWSRREIEQKVGAGAEEFWKNVDVRYAPALKGFLIDMGEKGATNLRYGARYVELWWNDKKMKIYQVGREHGRIIVEFLGLPFEALYAADQWIIPWADKMLRQTKEIVRTDKLVTIPYDRDLKLEDVMSAEKYVEFTMGTSPDKRRGFHELFDESINPNVSYFGIYQMPFYTAMTNKLAGKEAYYESEKFTGDEEHMNKLYGSPNVGYYISEVSQKDAPGKKPTDSTDNLMRVMHIASREQAKEVFKQKGVDEEDIDRYMQPIHVVLKNPNPQEEGPNKLYIFWRMPLKGSTELTLIKEGRLPDYIDPNNRKFRPPFEVDPSKGIIDNLKMAYGVNSPFLRKAGHAALWPLAQWLHVVFGMIEKGGKIPRKILSIEVISKGLGIKPHDLNFIEDITRVDETKLQWIDEFTSTAGLAPLSDFYKNPKNQAIYNEALKESRKRDLDLNLETKPDGTTPWDWKPIEINTGKKDAKGNPIYIFQDTEGKLVEATDAGIKEIEKIEKKKYTKKLGRLHEDMYKAPPKKTP